jgi:hypothetical protein
MFDRSFAGHLMSRYVPLQRSELGAMRRWIWIIWVIVGIVIAWEHVYITVKYLELLASAVLAVVLWPLVLLGVNLHVH